MGTSKSVLLFAQLPERNGAGGGNVEGIDPVGHGDAHRVIAGGNGGVGKAITLGAQHDGQLWLGGQGGIVDRNRKVGQRHGGGLEAESVQLLHALLRPVGGAPNYAVSELSDFAKVLPLGDPNEALFSAAIGIIDGSIVLPEPKPEPETQMTVVKSVKVKRYFRNGLIIK